MRHVAVAGTVVDVAALGCSQALRSVALTSERPASPDARVAGSTASATRESIATIARTLRRLVGKLGRRVLTFLRDSLVTTPYGFGRTEATASSVEAFDDHGHALTTADAHRLEAVAASGLLQ